MTITAAAPLSVIAPRDTLDVVATFETLVTPRGDLIIARDKTGHVVEMREGWSGMTYKYARGPFGTLVTEFAPNGAVRADTVPDARQVRDLGDLFA